MTTGGEEGDYGHPLGGWDIKKMAEQLDAVTDMVSGMALEVETLKRVIAEMSIIQAPPVGVFVPRNRRSW